MFNGDIRAFVPQIAMSAGTMIACTAREIVMGKQSSLGPIDPQMHSAQFGQVAAHGIIEEFSRAKDEIAKTPHTIPLWQPIIAKYSPTLIGECEKAIKWSTEMVSHWLRRGMFDGKPEVEELVKAVIYELGGHAFTKSHARHISAEKAQQIGLIIKMLEDDPALQDAVLSVHHSTLITFQETDCIKVIENHTGKGQMLVVRQQIQMSPQLPPGQPVPVQPAPPLQAPGHPRPPLRQVSPPPPIPVPVLAPQGPLEGPSVPSPRAPLPVQPSFVHPKPVPPPASPAPPGRPSKPRRRPTNTDK